MKKELTGVQVPLLEYLKGKANEKGELFVNKRVLEGFVLAFKNEHGFEYNLGTIRVAFAHIQPDYITKHPVVRTKYTINEV